MRARNRANERGDEPAARVIRAMETATRHLHDKIAELDIQPATEEVCPVEQLMITRGQLRALEEARLIPAEKIIGGFGVHTVEPL
jgi:hypothetical protein